MGRSTGSSGRETNQRSGEIVLVTGLKGSDAIGGEGKRVGPWSLELINVYVLRRVEHNKDENFDL